MTETKRIQYLQDVLQNMPADWLGLTTHRLDIYDESKAKVQFLEQFEALFQAGNAEAAKLAALPTAYDYIRLGHPLSSVLEWAIAGLNGLGPQQVISFSSQTMPILAVLRKNLFERKRSQIAYVGKLPAGFDAEAIRKVYGYDFSLQEVADAGAIPDFEGSTIFLSYEAELGDFELNAKLDFFVGLNEQLGSILVIHGEENAPYIADIQHLRRRETIAMTPADCFTALQKLTGAEVEPPKSQAEAHKKQVQDLVCDITGTKAKPLIGSSGLSMQYAIMMGLIDHALTAHPDKAIKIIVPPNCYGGTNDQARRVAACLEQVEVVDLPVDGDNDMVQSTDRVLQRVAEEDAVPLIIAEIPTNPRVEVPDLPALKAALTRKRQTPSGEAAIAPVFILDQTFCPNVQFLGEGEILSGVQAIAYVSGSKFPSGGKCTAGYCVANEKAKGLMDKIGKHLELCDNEATDLQLAFLAEQLPSMNQRIEDAYQNTREFVNFIEKTLPEAKINFVSEDLAEQGFTPSVFSLDLPTKGETEEERENYKRALNHELIKRMIGHIPEESKYCVSYGQLKGCYWTIPATSTQGTTKEADKDYIARVSLSGNMDLERHKEVFEEFVEDLEL